MTARCLFRGRDFVAVLLLSAASTVQAGTDRCVFIEDRRSVASHASVFFGVVENYTVDASSGRIDLQLADIVSVKGPVPTRVSVDPKQVQIKPLARHLFFTQPDGVVSPCSGSRPIMTSQVRETWNLLQRLVNPDGPGLPAPALRIAAVASNFCSIRAGYGSRSFRKVITLFDDGTIVVENGESRSSKRATRETVERIRQMRERLASSGEGVGWLSYVPPGVQELTLYFDDGEFWSAGPSYSRCGRTDAFGERYLTPLRHAVITAILAAANEPKAFIDCGCVPAT